MADQTQGFWQPTSTVNPTQYIGGQTGYNLYPIAPQTDINGSGLNTPGGYLYGTGDDPNNYVYSSHLYPYMVPSKIIPTQRSQTIDQAVSPTQYSVNGGNFLSASDPSTSTIYSQPSVAPSTMTYSPQQQGYQFGNRFIPGMPSPNAPGAGIQGGSNFIQQQPAWSNVNYTPQGLGTFSPWSPNLNALQNQNQGK